MRCVPEWLLAVMISCTAGFGQPLTILTEISPPYQVRGPDGRLTGYAVEVVREIQRRAGSQEPIEEVPWARGYQIVLNQPNTVLFLMVRNGERNELFHWVGPVAESAMGLYGRADSKLRLSHLEDARKLGSIGVVRGDVRDQILTQAGFTNLERTNSHAQNVMKLMANRIDAVFLSGASYGSIARSAGFKPGDLRELLRLQTVQTWIAFSKGTPDSVVKAWAAAFETMQRDHTLERLLKEQTPDLTILPGAPITSF